MKEGVEAEEEAGAFREADPADVGRKCPGEAVEDEVFAKIFSALESVFLEQIAHTLMTSNQTIIGKRIPSHRKTGVPKRPSKCKQKPSIGNGRE